MGGGGGLVGLGGGGTLSNSTSADFPLNNFSYEHLNNVKNRENSLINLKTAAAAAHTMSTSSSANYLLSTTTTTAGHNHLQPPPSNLSNGLVNSNQIVPNNQTTATLNNNNNNNNGLTVHHHHQQQQQQLIGNLIGSLQITNNNITSSNGLSADTARILSEKNALEKNLKKHSLFINALSWKRLAASHGKKKMDNCNNNQNNKNSKSSSMFRQSGMVVVDKNKTNMQHLIQTATSGGGNPATIFYNNGGSGQNGQNAPGLLDLVRVNNTNNNNNNVQQMDKLVTKLPISLPIQPPGNLLISNNNNNNHSNLTSNNLNQHNGHGPRKTVIQVS